MSFDIKLVDGDFSFGPDGNPVTVVDTEKMAQDIAKILLTRVGTDPGSTQYGTTLLDQLGQRFDFAVLQGLIAKSVGEAMNYLQSLQQVQGTKQTLSYQEVIGSIDALTVASPSFGKIQIQLAVTSMAGLRKIFAFNL